MRVGLIDVDGHRFPNLALMKISARHKRQGDRVEMAHPGGRFYDRVYASKVFTFTPDIDWRPPTDLIIRGGTGYSMRTNLPDDVEHIMPDYSLYGISDTAYGFLSRGCPRGCPFCIVGEKEGLASRKVADLREWWNGQPNIVLMDANVTACPDWRDLFGQLAESGAEVDINQGVDVRMLSDEKADALLKVRMKRIHFAWDGLDDLEPKFALVADRFRKMIRAHRVSVYVLVNFNSSMEWNLHRVETLRRLGFDPYVMVYDKKNAPPDVRRLQRWCNAKPIFKTVKFKDYNPV